MICKIGLSHKGKEMSTSNPLTEEEKDRFEPICEQVIDLLVPEMERARRKGVSPQFVSYYVLRKLRYILKRWGDDARLEPEDNALRQATEHAASLSYWLWAGEPLNEWLCLWKPKLVTSQTKMRRTK